MRVLKIRYNNGLSEGYFVETRKGYIHVAIKEEETFELKNIIVKKEIRINEATLKVEEVQTKNEYIN